MCVFARAHARVCGGLSLQIFWCEERFLNPKHLYLTSVKIFNGSRLKDSNKLLYGDHMWISYFENNTFLECIDDIADQLLRNDAIPRTIISLSQFWVSDLAQYDASKLLSQNQLLSEKLQEYRGLFMALVFKNQSQNEFKNSLCLWKFEHIEKQKGGVIKSKS